MGHDGGVQKRRRTVPKAEEIIGEWGSYVRSVLDLLDAELFGIPLKSALDCVLLVLVVYGTLTRGLRVARWTKAKVFGKKESLEAVIEHTVEQLPYPDTEPQEGAEMSPAASAAYDALCFEQCTYEPSTRRLFLPGLMVEFLNDDPNLKTVKYLMGSPVEGPNGRFLGDDLACVIESDEKEAIIAKAQDKRTQCLMRDRAKANSEAARGLSRAAHAARLKAYDESDGGYELSMEEGRQSSRAKKWLGQKQLRGGVGHLPIPKCNQNASA